MSVSLEQTRYFVDHIINLETELLRQELKQLHKAEKAKLLEENAKLKNDLADMELEIRELKHNLVLEVNQATELKEMIMDMTKKYEGHLPKESNPEQLVKLMAQD